MGELVDEVRTSVLWFAVHASRGLYELCPHRKENAQLGQRELRRGAGVAGRDDRKSVFFRIGEQTTPAGVGEHHAKELWKYLEYVAEKAHWVIRRSLFPIPFYRRHKVRIV